MDPCHDQLDNYFEVSDGTIWSIQNQQLTQHVLNMSVHMFTSNEVEFEQDFVKVAASIYSSDGFLPGDANPEMPELEAGTGAALQRSDVEM